jgi:adenine-specific DNA-methyltransferase
MQNLQNELIDLLKHEDNLVIDGLLNKNKIIELALKVEPQLIILLLKSETFKKHFFQEVEEVLVFDKIKFQRFVNNKSFLPDSYTAFKNKIGLITNDNDLDNFISTSNDVVLAWPHKDCVLEGGQTKEDQKRNEIFWNETLAPDSVDRLLDAKALTNFKKFDKDGEHKVTDLKGDENLIIKGNNLLALASLLKTHRGKIKLIYIDPPYNTGNDFGYNDKFNHSAWLTFMKNRLQIAHKLLSNDGSIWINIDDRESHYLKVLTDDIFGRDNFINNIIWQKKFAPQNDAKFFSDNHDHILLYAKSISNFKINPLKRDEQGLARYKNPDNDKRGNWVSSDMSAKRLTEKDIFEITTPDGSKYYPPKGTSWRYSKDKFQELIKDNRVWFGEKGGNVPRLKRFLSEVKEGVTPLTIWTHKEVSHNQEAKQEINKLELSERFETPKPEKLIQRIIHIGSNESDIVLDFFGGSFTTASVSLKMNRKFIATEQMDYINTVSIPRILHTIKGHQGGISKDVDWQGGGSFVYAELMQYNQKYIDAIQNAETKEQLITVWNEMQDTAFLSYQFDKKTFNERLDAFKTAPIEEMKQYLVEVLDKNQLYVNYSEINDDTFKVSQEDKDLNKQFYSKK